MTPDYPSVRRRFATGLILSCVLAPGAATSATIAVAGDCTLAHAIANANADADTDGAHGCVAGSGDDTLELTPNAVYRLSRVNNISTSENGLPFVNSIIRINGHGATIARSTVQGTPGFRLLHVGHGGALTILDLKLTGGEQPGRITYGGAIVNEGVLRLVRCTVVANSATFGGGVATIGGTTTLIDSLITGNHADHFVVHSVGGGVLSDAGRTTLIRSTVAGNDADFGGGITNQEGGILSVNNSTLSGNTARENGGGIINFFGAVAVNASTLSGNRNLGAGHPINRAGTATLFNHAPSDVVFPHPVAVNLTGSIVANSRGGSECAAVEGGTTTLRGVNLIEDGSCGSPFQGDSRLGPLLDNGGFTPTQGVLSGSIALNAVEPTLCVGTDQRGIKRPQPDGSRCDLGAFESVSGIPLVVRDLITFFDAQVAGANLVGAGFGPMANHRRNAFRQQLLTAGHYQDQKQERRACLQLDRSLQRIQIPESGSPDTYVSGAAAAELDRKIRQIRTSWRC